MLHVIIMIMLLANLHWKSKLQIICSNCCIKFQWQRFGFHSALNPTVRCEWRIRKWNCTADVSHIIKTALQMFPTLSVTLPYSVHSFSKLKLTKKLSQSQDLPSYLGRGNGTAVKLWWHCWQNCSCHGERV
jgi:hypothetical protein